MSTDAGTMLFAGPGAGGATALGATASGGPGGQGRARRAPIVTSAAIKELFDRLPPHSPEAEMSLLGAMILDPRVIGDVIGVVQSGEACYQASHGAIFDALVRLYDKHQSGDLVQLTQALRDTGALEAVGGADYLVRLAEEAPASVNAPHYARIVGEKWRLRKLIDAAGQILYEAFHAGQLGPEGASDTIDRAEQRIFEIAEQRENTDAQRLADLLQEVYDALEDNRGSRLVTGVTTGYYDLDEMTSGLQPGEMIIIAARPSMGKTALALNLAEQIAMGGAPGVKVAAPQPVAVFSMEMSRQAVAQRFMCARAGIDSHLLRTNRLGDDEFHRLGATLDELSAAPLYVDDAPALTILQLRARARRLRARHKIGCIVIDYLQLMTAPASSESRQVEVSAISRGVKALARELEVPVVCLSQLNRAAEQREGHRPRMSDLRESGSIEQDADVIMLLHREEYFHQGDTDWTNDPENAEKVGLAELIIAKQRNGPTGVVELQWDSRMMRFRNRSSGYRHAPPADVATREPRPAAANGPAHRAAPPPPGPGGAPFIPSQGTLGAPAEEAPFEPKDGARPDAGWTGHFVPSRNADTRPRRDDGPGYAAPPPPDEDDDDDLPV